MSAVGGSEEQFLCSICLDTFSEPVSTPCGHNFCKRCISQTWEKSENCVCPLCNEVFSTRPQLRTNTLLSEVVSKSMLEKRSISVDDLQASGEVLCDVCPEPRLKALKSCLVCQSSFCESHLQPHLRVSGLKKHQLMEPVDNMEDRVCQTHDHPLELFCDTDKMAICIMCSVLGHKNHRLVPLKEAFEQEKVSLQQTIAENQRLIEQRRLKVQEISAALELDEREAKRETQQMEKVFKDIMESIQKCLAHHIQGIKQTLTKQKELGQALIQHLQQEMCELERSITEAQQLSLSTDLFHFIQHRPALSSSLKDWSSENFEPEVYEGTVDCALSELERNLPEKFNEAFGHLPPEYQLRRVQKSAVEVTLNEMTAHPNLTLSEDCKQVYYSDVTEDRSQSPLSFTEDVVVLGNESFFSKDLNLSFYFEVRVTGKTEWALGVARKSVCRKEKVAFMPKNGFWNISLRNGGKYEAGGDPAVPLSPQTPPQKVGVFVDYGAGRVSFYDVDAPDHLFSFTRCCFREKLFPFFSPGLNASGNNSAPLIISPGGRVLKSKCSIQ